MADRPRVRQEETIPPSLEKLMVILEEFMLKHELSVVLVDKVSGRSAVFLLSVDPDSLNVQERSIPERELRVVRDR